FSENVFGEAAIERFEGALGLVGGHVEGWHHDIGDAEYDLLRRLRGFRLAGGVLRRAEDGIDARRRQPAGGLAALEARQGFALEMMWRVDFVQRRTSFELVQQLRCLGV